MILLIFTPNSFSVIEARVKSLCTALHKAELPYNLANLDSVFSDLVHYLDHEITGFSP